MNIATLKQWIKSLSGVQGGVIFKNNDNDPEIASPLTPLPVTQYNSTNRPRHIFLTDTGNGQGTISYTGNYSTTSKDIYYEALTKFEIHTLSFNVSDDAKFSQTGYGGDGVLINGVKFFFKPSGQPEVPLFGGHTIKKNLDIMNWTQDSLLTTFNGNADTLAANIHAPTHYGMPFYMNVGDRFIVRLHDNFSFLTGQSFYIGGKEII